MPSGTSLISEGDDLLRQHWDSLDTTIVEEHYFNDSAASAGIHKPGSARVFYGPASATSAVGASTDDGRLYLESDTGNLYQVGQAQTRANYGGGVCVASPDGGQYVVIGDVSFKNRGIYSSIINQWGPLSTDTWAVLSDSSLRLVTVPSNLSGYFAIQYDVQSTNGILVNSSGADKIFINVVKNGLSVYTATTGPLVSARTLLNLTLNYVLAAKAGDTINVRAWHDDNIAIADRYGTNQLSIYKVG